MYGDIRLEYTSWEGSITSETGVSKHISLSLHIPEFHHQSYGTKSYSKNAFSQITSADMAELKKCELATKLTHVNVFELYVEGKSESPALKDRIFLEKSIFVSENVKEDDEMTNKNTVNVIDFFQPLHSGNFKNQLIFFLAELKNESWVGGLFIANGLQYRKFADFELSPSNDQSSGIKKIDDLSAESDFFSFKILKNENNNGFSSQCTSK